MLGKQWLSSYQSVGEQGDDATRGLERQRKFDALQAWHFRAILEVIPVLLQHSLILFGAGLCSYIWIQQRTIAIISIITNGIGAIFYFTAVGVSVAYEDSPFQMPLSAIFRRWSRRFQQSWRQLSSAIQHFRQTIIRVFRRATWVALRTSSHRIVQRLRTNVRSWPRRALSLGRLLGLILRRSTGQTSRTHQDDKRSHLSSDEKNLEVAVQWLLVTSTDARLQVDVWPLFTAGPWSRDAILALPISVLDRLLYDIRLCFDKQDGGGLLALESYGEALSRISAFLLIFWEKLAGNFDETHGWVERVTRTERNHLFSCVILRFPETAAPPHAHLPLLGRLFKETVHHLCRVNHSKINVYPIVSSRLDANRSDRHEGLCGRTLLYLARQAAAVSSSVYTSNVQDAHWDDERLLQHSLEGVISASRLALRSSLPEAERIVCVIAPLIAVVPVKVKFDAISLPPYIGLGDK